MRRRLLIVTSTYAPAMMADMQRARLLAWELPELGWDVEILSPDTAFQAASSIDSDSSEFFCPGTPVHYAPQRHASLYRLLGLGTIGWRSLFSMNRLAAGLFRKQRYDLVYFSTTQFNLFLLGWFWRWRHGLRYVLDFHDPCFRPSPGFAGGTPPGLKRWLNGKLLGFIERASTRSASGLVSVSPNYVEEMRQRYSDSNAEWLRPGRHMVIPFGASMRDLATASPAPFTGAASAGSLRRIVYVGAGGPIMSAAFRTICMAMAELRQQQDPSVENLRVELFGTMLGWRAGERKHLLEIATEFGLDDIVHESPPRVTYRRSLELLRGADGVFVLGVDDEGYIPSKLFSYALSGKPLLAAFNVRSSAYSLFMSHPEFGHVLGFGVRAGQSDTAGVMRSFLNEVERGSLVDRTPLVQPYLASSMARRHVELFDACVAGSAAAAAVSARA